MIINKDKEWFVACLKNKPLVESLKKIKLVISDIDGCLTDGKVFYHGNDHEIQKGFSIQDGYMINQCCKKNLLKIAFVTGRVDQAARRRAEVLGIPKNLYHEGIDENKCAVVEKVINDLGITKEETIFFGDDFIDLQTKNSIAMLISPTNAMFYVHSNSEIIVPRHGGNGAIRLLLDLILYIQNKHFAQEFITKAID